MRRGAASRRCWAVVQRRGQGHGAGVVTAVPSWVAKRPQTLRPGRGLAAQRVVAGREDVRTPATPVVACPRPLSAVRTSVQSVTRTSGVHASGVHATDAIQVSGQTGLRCPRLCSLAVRTALDPGTAQCGAPSPLGAMGSRCHRGPRAAWSPTRMGPDGRGWCWVGRGWPAPGSPADLGRRIARPQAAAPPCRLADKGAGPAPGRWSVG